MIGDWADELARAIVGGEVGNAVVGGGPGPRWRPLVERVAEALREARKIGREDRPQ